MIPSKITPIEVAMLAIYERFDALEALKSGSSGMTGRMDISRKIFEVLDFLLRIQKGILAMDLDTSIDSWCFAVLNGVFWETVLKYTTIHELPTDQTI